MQRRAGARHDGAGNRNMEHHRGELRIDEPLSRHTVWGIGGPAKRFYLPAGITTISAVLPGRDCPTGEADLLAGTWQQRAGA